MKNISKANIINTITAIKHFNYWLKEIELFEKHERCEDFLIDKLETDVLGFEQNLAAKVAEDTKQGYFVHPTMLGNIKIYLQILAEIKTGDSTIYNFKHLVSFELTEFIDRLDIKHLI